MKLPPALTTCLTLLAYALLSIFIVMRLFIKKRSNSAIFRSVGMGALMLISAIDLIWVFADDHKSTTWVVNIFNVFLILFFIRAIREIWIQFSIVMIKSVPVFIIMLSYFILFVIIGFILFANNESDKSFFTINESMYTVFILFTVSNYPDVQTPYFENSRLSMLYFWAFLLIGIFLLSNLLLAQVFMNYKKLVDEQLKRFEKDVNAYFLKLFNDIKPEKNVDFITCEQLTEVLGG